MRTTLLKSLGWDSMGRYFSTEKKNVPEESRIGEPVKLQEVNRDPPMKKSKSEKSIAESEEFEGPDTSSLTAFLLSLLSYPTMETGGDDTSSSDGSSDSEGEAESLKNQSGGASSDAKHRTGFSFFSRTGSSWIRGTRSQTAATNQGLVPAKVKEKEREGGGDIPVHESDKIHGEESSEAEWQLVSDADLSSGKSHPSAKILKENGDVETPKSPFRLPDMSEESSLLTEGMRIVIYNALPALARGREWVLLYSTVKHGISLLTLYRRSALAQGPCLLVVTDKEGDVFGGLSTGPLHPSTKKKYQGTSDSFVFTDVSGSIQLYRASGVNRYFVLCMNDALAFGGGGHFALRLDGELLNGSSGVCETFGSPCLAKNEEFAVKKVELWGFAHTSRYAPKASTWHEPEVTPGIHTW